MAALTFPHWEALTPQTCAALRVAGQLPFMREFYLAGGTGLALHLGHRFSVGLDFWGLVCFEDAERLPMPRMIDRTPWPKMKRFLEQQALEGGRKQLESLWE